MVLRARLIERLNEGFQGKLTIVSAPAGFGKSTLVSEWIATSARPAAWLSLDEADNDPPRFLAYLVAASQTVAPGIGEGVLGLLESPQPLPIESVLTVLLNDITTVPDRFVLVLDDYHLIDSRPIDQAVTFLLRHLPPQMHLVISTREDPQLPLARLRARSQLTELRANDLRFTPSEAANFLNEVMGLNLSAEQITALEDRTEGWVAGLQLAGLALQGTIATQGHQEISRFVRSFTGSHHFVLDYLLEEVLYQQPEGIQTFLLRTSILSRLCGPLCDAILLDPSVSGQETLEYLERANLFTIPLDSQRRWYRYHHLFAELLQQWLPHSIAGSTGDTEGLINELHIRASQWYEDNGLEIEAFRHAAAAHDIERAERLAEGKGIPLHRRGAVITILDWLESLPFSVLNARPSLWWRHASLLLVIGQTTGVQEKLDAAEAGLAAILQGSEPDAKARLLIGRIAAARAVLALTRYDSETMLVQSRRALEYLSLDRLSMRANANWTLGVAYAFRRERAAARRALAEAISLSRTAGDIFTTILATLGMAEVEEVDNQLHEAAQIYQRILQLAGDQPLQIVNEAHLGLARILYEWNDLDGAEQHARQSLRLAREYDRVIDRYIISEVFLARLKLARGDVDGAAAMLTQTSETVRQKNFVQRISEVAAAQVVTLLRQGDLAAAAHLVEMNQHPVGQARVLLAQGDTSTALTVLEHFRREVEAKEWHDERLRAMALQAVAYAMHGERDQAVQVLSEALVLAEPGGFIRLFVDEGPLMAQLLSEAADQGATPDYTRKLLAAFDAEERKIAGDSHLPDAQPLVDPLSQRELEILQLIAEGHSNQEIGERLFLALDTIKGHNRRIFDKLNVQRRTEAVARARELGLL
jgi:LuxR family transcriptional regulator, maltose regulon positive regulatory protein